ncbi:hypothetical protein DXG01_010021 [Tephrocybe rancida]|nr:hypothetical protein DXG01_010021 [Tephrocybe rancida]
MRPWRHVIERLLQRTTDLHDIIHYPSPGLSSDDVRTQMADMMKRVEHLERALSKAKVYDYVEEAVAVVDCTVKRHEKKYEKQEVRVHEMELLLEGMKGKGKQHAGHPGMNVPGPAPAAERILSIPVPVLALPASQARDAFVPICVHDTPPAHPGGGSSKIPGLD